MCTSKIKVLEFLNVSVNLEGKNIVDNINFSVYKNDWCMILGKNGSGKTTTISALTKQNSYSGQIFLNGKDIQSFTQQEYAKNIGFLSQNNTCFFNFTVKEIVSMGRYSYKKHLLDALTLKDKKIINNMLKITGLEKLQDKKISELSGGETQRVFLAQVFAQNPNILVLDEPTNNLDLIYQKQIFDLLKFWIKDKNKTIISIIHDIPLAKYYGNTAILLNEGKIIDCNTVKKVLSNNKINNVYQMNIKSYFQEMYNVFTN